MGEPFTFVLIPLCEAQDKSLQPGRGENFGAYITRVPGIGHSAAANVECFERLKVGKFDWSGLRDDVR